MPRRRTTPDIPKFLTWDQIPMEDVELFIMQGLSDHTISRRLGISYKNWRALCNDGSDYADAVAELFDARVSEVEASLFQRAIGWEKVDEVPILDRNGDPVLDENGEPIVERKVTRMAPDVPAMQFYLKNRAPDRWRDKVDHDINATVETTLSDVDRAELARRIAFAMNSVQYVDADFEEVDDPKRLSTN